MKRISQSRQQVEGRGDQGLDVNSGNGRLLKTEHASECSLMTPQHWWASSSKRLASTAPDRRSSESTNPVEGLLAQPQPIRRLLTNMVLMKTIQFTSRFAVILMAEIHRMWLWKWLNVKWSLMFQLCAGLLKCVTISLQLLECNITKRQEAGWLQCDAKA